jgi:drug/metabolite transporter (DMT)-like permease
VITAALAIVFLGEPLTRYKIAGVAFALAAIWLLLAVPAAGTSGRQRESQSSLVRVVVATAAVGIGNLIYKYGLRAGATPASLIVAQAIVVLALGTAFVAAVDRRIQPSRPVLRYAPAAAIVLAIAFALMVESLARGDASVMVPIAQMGFAITALLGFLVLREPFTLRKGIGLVAAFAALASFASGWR